MKEFVKSKGSKELNVGFALDEGIASPNNVFELFNGDRPCWRKFLLSLNCIES